MMRFCPALTGLQRVSLVKSDGQTAALQRPVHLQLCWLALGFLQRAFRLGVFERIPEVAF